MKKILLATVAMATAPIVFAAASAPASAQSKLAIAVVNVDAAIGSSAAAQTASQQMQVTYKTSIDSFNARQTALQAQIKAKQDALQAAATAAGAKPTPVQQAALQKQYDELQKSAQDAQNELNALRQPTELAKAYVIEQIGAKLEEALKNVMTKNKVDLLLKDESALAYQPNVDLTSALVTEINTLVPDRRHRAAAGLASGPAAAGRRRARTGCRRSPRLPRRRPPSPRVRSRPDADLE